MSRFVIQAGLYVCVLLAGCVSVAPFDNENQAELRENLPQLPQTWVNIPETEGSNRNWLLGFNDPVLDQLIEEALANNPSLQGSAANIEGSRAQLALARSTLSPIVSGYAGASRTDYFSAQTTDVDALSLGAQLSWELDLWGELRSGVLGAVYTHDALTANFHYAQQSLAANTAIAYFSAIEAKQQADITRENVRLLEDMLRIVGARHRDGMSSPQDLALARSDLATARESLAATEGSYRQTLRALEILIGRYPSASLMVNPQLPSAPDTPPVGIPSQLLERRPDVMAAELAVAATFKALDSAKAARLPSLSLSGTLGGASSDLSNLLDPTNTSWQLASNLLAPLIDGGALQAQVDTADAESRQAIADYRYAALNAFSEVENALDQDRVIAARAEAQQAASLEAEEAFRIANALYKEGESDLLDVLTIQQRVISARSNLLSIQRQQLEQRVNLHLALGGDWE